MPKVDKAKVVTRTGGIYPPPWSEVTSGRVKSALGNACGLTQFGVNLTRLKPGAASALRHWHESEDEFVYVLEGEITLIEDGSETVLTAGDAAGFKAGDPNGHCLVNKSTQDALYLEVGTRADADRYYYSDIDMMGVKDAAGVRFLRKSGEPLG